MMRLPDDRERLPDDTVAILPSYLAATRSLGPGYTLPVASGIPLLLIKLLNVISVKPWFPPTGASVQAALRLTSKNIRIHKQNH